MVKEFTDGSQALALAQSLGLFMTKKKGVYIVGNTKDEICKKHNMGFWDKDEIFYDADIYEVENTENDSELRVRNRKIKDARDMELPYGIKHGSWLFAGCSKLKYPPKIPDSMTDCGFIFSRCISLKEAPEFPQNSNHFWALENTPYALLFEKSKKDQITEKVLEFSFLGALIGVMVCTIALMIFSVM